MNESQDLELKLEVLDERLEFAPAWLCENAEWFTDFWGLDCTQ